MKTIGQYFLIVLGPVLGRLISINPGLKFVLFLYFTFLCIAKSNILCYHYCILELTLNSESSSCVFLDKKVFLKNLALSWVKLNHLWRNRVLFIKCDD